MCNRFIRGLKPEIEQRIARSLDLQLTIADALRIERDLQDIAELRQDATINRNQSSLSNTRWTICQGYSIL